MSTDASASGTATGRWLQRRANDIAVLLIATMFVSFLLQIVFRYALDKPLGWTEEVTVLCWVWIVLWGASFIVAERDEVRFDIVYNLVPLKLQRVFTIASSLGMIALMGLSLPATWRYVAFMRREHSAYLGMRFDYLYSIYLLFAVVCIVRQARVTWQAWRGVPLHGAADELTERAE
ncbi:MAG TPA: TRAP transporter small permease subunit [Caldimonas sp.]|nr:TRAP transporter small permease subunit [Caldimonas sp.]